VLGIGIYVRYNLILRIHKSYFSKGPSIGVALYSLGGFSLPFLVMGGIGITTSIILTFLVPKVERRRESQDELAMENESLLTMDKPSLTVKDVLKVVYQK